MTTLTAVLEVYSLEEIFELNDLTSEDILEYLVRHRLVVLPEILPVEFD